MCSNHQGLSQERRLSAISYGARASRDEAAGEIPVQYVRARPHPNILPSEREKELRILARYSESVRTKTEDLRELEHLFDGLSQNAAARLQSNLFLGPKIHFNDPQDTFASHNRWNGNRHITQTVSPVL